MPVLELDMVQTVALAVILLVIGQRIVKRSKFLSTYCIPAPVVGGLIFAILALILRQTNVIAFEMDTTLQSFAMTMFFTSVGFSASLAILKDGGKKVFQFLAVAVLLVVFQGVIGVLLSKVVNVDPLIGLATGPISMTGGHGTAAAFGPVIEDLGIDGGNTIAVAAATFGLIAGGLIGGPVGSKLIEKNNLSAKDANAAEGSVDVELDTDKLKEDNIYTGTYLILIAMGLGTIISGLFESLDLTFPQYIGAMLVGALIRNIFDAKGRDFPMAEIDVIGGVALSLFLSMALMTLRLWELIDLAVPFIILLVAQVVFMFLYAQYVTFKVMGSDYDAAILASGHCGFGLGATPNGVANMTSVTNKYGPSPTAFFVLPIVGGLFIDFLNAGVITIFINFIT